LSVVCQSTWKNFNPQIKPPSLSLKFFVATADADPGGGGGGGGRKKIQLVSAGQNRNKKFECTNPILQTLRETDTVRISLISNQLHICWLIRTLLLLQHSYNKSQKDAAFLNFILVKNSTCFGQIYCPSTGVLILHSHQLVFVIIVTLTDC